MKHAFSLTLSTALLVVAVVFIDNSRISHGCAAAPPPDQDVTISDETALIVWDSANQTEHFIRNANFETTAKDFGFLVPTPSIPTLHESGGRVLSELAARTAARKENRYVEIERFRLFKPGTGFDFFQNIIPGATFTDGAARPAGAVEVIDEVSVAGYDATILKASDAGELLEWLKENDYAARPALLEWLEAYTQNGWYLTAFKISSAEKNASSIVARPVRMTFKTEEPFYPYREPTDARASTSSTDATRLLRLYVLSDQKMEGRLGKSETVPAKTVWANQLPDHDVSNLNRLFRVQNGERPDVINAATLFLTEFEDHSSPRPGTDELFLVPASDSGTVERPPVVRTVERFVYSPNLYKAPFWVLGLGLAFVVNRRLRTVR